MKLIEQSHKIINISDTPLEDIELAGRTCYKSEDKIVKQQQGRVDEITEPSAKKFVKMLRDRGHHAMLEFGFMTVKFVTNRGVTHELVRHRLCSFAQESTRYCNYGGKDMEFIKPVWLDEHCRKFYNKKRKEPDAINFQQRGLNKWRYCKEGFKQINCVGHDVQCEFLTALELSETYYNNLLNDGWKPQQAREVLPNALKTEIVVMANLREWRHIFKLRCDKAAHPQMVALMRPLLVEVKRRVPVLFDDIYPDYPQKGQDDDSEI